MFKPVWKALWETIKVIAAFVWRAFGLFLMVVGFGAVGGAMTGDVWTGIVTIWSAGVVVAVGYIGYKITSTGRATVKDVEIAMRKAVQQLREQQSKKQ
jgi:hypothetical protein